MCEATTARRIIDLVLELDVLDRLPRMGFQMCGVTVPETVAAHCFGVALLAMLMADAVPERVDAERVLRMALLHEASEARITDLPYDTMRYITSDIKSCAEAAAADDLLRAVGAEYVSLWEEFEAAKTLEARIVRAADKIQMMAKVLRYDREGRGDLAAFWRNTAYNEDDRGIALAGELFAEIRRRHLADLEAQGQCQEERE